MMFSLQNCEFEGFTYKCTLGVVVTLVGGWEGSLDTQVCITLPVTLDGSLVTG